MYLWLNCSHRNKHRQACRGTGAVGRISHSFCWFVSTMNSWLPFRSHPLSTRQPSLCSHRAGRICSLFCPLVKRLSAGPHPLCSDPFPSIPARVGYTASETIWRLNENSWALEIARPIWTERILWAFRPLHSWELWLAVDMFYIPYLWEKKYCIKCGWHFCTVLSREHQKLYLYLWINLAKGVRSSSVTW